MPTTASTSHSFATFLTLATALFVSTLALHPRTLNAADKSHAHGTDSMPNAATPCGTVTGHEPLSSKVFPCTKRRCSLHVPAQSHSKNQATLIVFQDGHTFINQLGDFRVPVVFDNLITKAAMPVTIAVMIDPSHKGELPDKRGWKPTPANRSVEYDTVSSDCADFLLTDVFEQSTLTNRLWPIDTWSKYCHIKMTATN